MLPPPSPIDATYIAVIGVTLCIGVILTLRKAHPALHCFVAGLILFCAGIWAYSMYTKALPPEMTIDMMLKMPQPPATVGFLSLGASTIVTAVWLAIFRNWLGPRTKTLCIITFWILIALAPVAYQVNYVESTLPDWAPDMTKQEFLAMLDRSNRIGMAQTILLSIAVVCQFTLYVTPVAWKLRQWRKTS